MEKNIIVKFDELLYELEILEKSYRNKHMAALDIDDEEISRIEMETISNKYRNVKTIKKQVIDLKNKLAQDCITNEENNENVVTNAADIDTFMNLNKNTVEDEFDTKIGVYVRCKMRELSSSGYVFKSETLENLLSDTKATLGFNIPLFKIYDEKKDIREQIKLSNYNRYWNEVFTFGNKQLLICSQWFEEYRDAFDEFFEWLRADNYSIDKNIIKKHENVQNIIEIREYKDDGRALKSLPTNNCANFDKDYTGCKPENIILLNQKIAVKNWNEVLVSVCNCMILYKPYIVAKFDTNEELNSRDRINFSFIESEVKFNGKKLSNGLWVETNRSANDIVKISYKILEICGFTHSDLSIEYEK